MKELITSSDSLMLEPSDFTIQFEKAQKEFEVCIKKYRVPNFKAKTINNDSMSLSSFEDKVIVINFWSSNCPPCLVELPILNKIAVDFKKKEVIFISLNKDGVGKNMKKYVSDLVTIENATEIFDLYGVVGYPQTLVLRKNQFVQHLFFGINTKNIEGFENEIVIEINKALYE
ncbi:MAG: TlpA family protein disulfide reductase [Ferruginibacter sp.]|nr:TlpA family protein disulfide reductase [Ferruginibacter sp.]